MKVCWTSGVTRPAKGSFTYRIKGIIRDQESGEELFTTPAVTLTVQVNGTALHKTVTVSQKGAIDLMKPDSRIVLTVKAKGLNTQTELLGSDTHIKLTGKDASLFMAERSSDGTQIYISLAKPASSYLTGKKYDVKLDGISVVHPSGEETVITGIGKKLNIALKQSKPKLTLTPAKGTIAGTDNAAGNILSLRFAASVPDGSAKIKSVSLVYDKSVGDALQLQPVKFDSDQQGGTLELRQTKMLKKGAKYTVKLLVVYENQAANAKETIVSFKVTVK